MKQRMKKLLALLLSVSMAMAPVSVYAEDGSIPVQTELTTEAVTEANTETVIERASEKTTEANTEGDTEATVVTEAAAEEQTQAASETMPETESEFESESESEMVFAGETLPENEAEGGSALLAMPRATDGVTTPVDCTTTLADGEYTPEAFKVVKASDGTTPKTAFTCKKITVKDGKAEATIEIASGAYTYMKANGQQYPGTCTDTASTFTFPVDLNVENDILGFTSKMNTEVAYKMLITLNETASTEAGTESESESESETETETETETEVKLPNYGDGEYGIGIESDFSMFKITSTSAQVSGGTITVTIGTSKTTYNKIYLGSVSDSEETKNANAIEGVANENGGYNFTFALPKEMMGKSVPFSPCKLKDGTWYVKNQYYLTVPADLDYTDGSYDMEIGSDFSMFKITSTSASVSGGNIMVTIGTSKTTYNKIYLGSVSDPEETKNAQAIEGAANESGGYDFTFALPKSMMGKSVPFSPCKLKDGTWYVKKQYYLTIPEVMNKVNSDAGYADGSYTIPVESDNDAFVITSAKASVVKGKIQAVITTGQSVYDRIYFGSVSDAKKDSFVTGTAGTDGYYSFTFTLTKDQLGANIAFVPGNAEGWYAQQCYMILPDTMEEEKELVKTQYGLVAQRQYYRVDGGYEVCFTETYPKSDYNFAPFRALYRFYYDNVDYGTDPQRFIYRTDNGDGTYCFRFFVSDEYLQQNDGKFTYLVQYADGSWVLNENNEPMMHIQMNVAGFNDTKPAYGNGTYSGTVKAYLTVDNRNVLSNFNVTSSEITVAGDEVTLVIRNNCAAYDRLYIGTAQDADKSVFVTRTVNEANTDAPYEYVIKLPKSSLCSEVSFVPGNSKTGLWSARTWKLVLPYQMTKTSSDPTEEIKDGDYTVGVESSATMFKVVNCVLHKKDGAYTAELVLSSTGYDSLYLGKAEDAAANESKWIKAESTVTYKDANGEEKTGTKFVLPVSALDTPIAVAAHAVKSGTWYDRTLTFKSSTLEKVDASASLADGDYSVGVTTGESMFKVVNAVLTKKNGVKSALITLSGTGYDYLFMGKAEDASAQETGWIAVKDTVTYKDSTGAEKTGARYEIPVSALDTPIAVASHAIKSGKWMDRTLTFDSSTLVSLGEKETESESETDTEESESASETESESETEVTVIPDDATAAVDNSTTLKDGVYTPDQFSFQGGSGKTKITCDKIRVKDGKAFAVIKFSSASYTYVKASAGKYMNLTPGEKSTFEIPVALNKDNTVIGNTTAMGEAKEITYTICPSLSKTAETETETETEIESETETETETETEGGKPVDPSKLPNGNYNVDVETGAAMFKVVQAVLTKKNGAMTAVITLSGTGYDYLYMGSASDAPKKESKWIAVKDVVNYKDSNGVTKSGARYEIPVAALDQAIALAARSASKETWFDRSLLFDSRTLEKIETSETETETETESETETEADTKADTESKYESDLSGGTSAVDSSTTLKDGVYTPDKFSWSGGSGRTSISCNKITVTNGRAYATIVFSSSSYEYVKANGNKYYGTKGAGTTSFVIPIQLNANNTIIGMTTAMSASHEITYSIYVYLKAADQSSKTENGDGEAPEIVGLSYESETKLEHAEYFRIFNYSDGIKLIEIDMVSDTLRDPDLEDAEAEEVQTEAETDAAEEEIAAEDEEVVQTADEIAAELYLADTVKYLVVPEDVEIPVGLDKEMIIVTVPAQSAYIASEEAMTAMEELELTEWIKASGFEAEECKSESVAKAMEEEKTVFAGSYEDPQFRQLILSGCDLAIFPEEILVKEEETQEDDLERFAQITSGFATLGIPMLVDRSADEEEPLAQAEWMLVYGVLFGCEEQAEAWYQDAVSAQE